MNILSFQKKLAYQKKIFYQKQIEKAIKKHCITRSPDIEVIRKLKCQTVEPWKRLLVIIFGIMFIALSLALISKAPDQFYILIGLFIFGLIIIILAILGKKKTIDELLPSLGDGLLNAILSGL